MMILFLFIDLYFLIPTVIPQIFNPTAELVIPTIKPTKKVKRNGNTSSNCRN